MRQLRRALINLPDAFDEAIDMCVHRVLNQSQTYRDLALRAMLWISYAYRPLMIQEVQQALAVDPEDSELNADGIYDVDVILTSCGGLVSLDEESNTLRFVSLGVQEWLHSKGGGIFPLDPHYAILETCMTFFQFKDFAECWNEKEECHPYISPDLDKDDEREQKTRLLLEKYPLWKYAAEHWPAPQRMATDSQAAELTVKILLDDNKAGFLYMVYYMTQFQTLAALSTFITGLHVSCLFGLNSTDRLVGTLKEQYAER